jgi:hypothetical protein
MNIPKIIQGTINDNKISVDIVIFFYINVKIIPLVWYDCTFFVMTY